MVHRVENKWSELLEDLRVMPPAERLKEALARRVAEVRDSAEATGPKPVDFSGSFPPGLMSEKIREIAEQLGIDGSRVGTTEHIHRTAQANFPWTMGSSATAERIRAYLEAVATEKLRRRS